jgi:outer membrane protein TolC
MAQVASNHPERAVDEHTAAVADESVRRAGLLPDPELTVGRSDVVAPDRYQPDPVEPMDRERAQWQIGLTQRFPWPGTLRAEERAAAAGRAATGDGLEANAAVRRFQAQELYLRMVRTAKLLANMQANQVVVDGIREFLHQKFRQGAGSHMEFLQAHSESGVLKANVAALATDLRNLKRHALLLIGDEALDPDAVDFDLDWPAADGSPTADFARRNLARDQEAAAARRLAAYRRSLPAFMLSGMGMREDTGMKMYSATIGLSLPLYSNIERGALSREDRAAEARLGAALTWYDRRKALATAQTKDRIAQLAANVEVLSREVVAPLREHVEGATVEFSQGRGTIDAVIASRRNLLELQATEIMTREALAAARLDLAMIEAGFADEVLDRDVPQLGSMPRGVGGMGGTSAVSGMPAGALPKGGQKPAAKRDGAAASGAPTAPATGGDEVPAGGRGGMGM